MIHHTGNSSTKAQPFLSIGRKNTKSETSAYFTIILALKNSTQTSPFQNLKSNSINL